MEFTENCPLQRAWQLWITTDSVTLIALFGIQHRERLYSVQNCTECLAKTHGVAWAVTLATLRSTRFAESYYRHVVETLEALAPSMQTIRNNDDRWKQCNYLLEMCLRFGWVALRIFHYSNRRMINTNGMLHEFRQYIAFAPRKL